MNQERQKLIQRFEELTNSDVYILFTAGGIQQYAINGQFLPIYTETIFSRRKARRDNAILVLETDGGSSPAVMAAVLQLRECYKHVSGYVFNRCYSAGTVGMFATDEIFMSKYGFMGPIDTQFSVGHQGAVIKPVIAYFNTFLERKPDVREREFAASYPEEYLMAITDLNYDFQTVFPNFKRHFDVSEKGDLSEEEITDLLLEAWNYFDGGAGHHATNITRTKARELGLSIKDIPEDIEEIMFEIISSYIADTNMMVDSIDSLHESDAFFETLGISYVHYYNFQETQQEIDKIPERIQNTETETPKSSNKKIAVADKYCIEEGWKKVCIH